MYKIITADQVTTINGNFYLKGIIHTTLVDGKHIEFETLVEDFFYSGLEKDGYFLSQDDLDIRLESELEHYDWGIEVKEDWCYSVLFKFVMHDTSGWTSCGWEYDSEVECLDLHIIPVSEEANKLYLSEDSFFQFEE